jgi:hypothetical protein
MVPIQVQVEPRTRLRLGLRLGDDSDKIRRQPETRSLSQLEVNSELKLEEISGLALAVTS